MVLVAALGCDRAPESEPAAASGNAAVTQVAGLDTLVPIPQGADTLVRRSAVRADFLPHNGSAGDARSHIVFDDSSTLDVPVRHARLLDALPAERGPDWLLVAGAECSECDAPVVVWVFRGVPGTVSRQGLAFVFPGALTEAGVDETPFFRSRLFLGECTSATTRTAVWFEETLQPDSAKRHIVRVLHGAPRLRDTTFAWTPTYQSDILARVQSGTCREVDPDNQGIL